MMTDKSISECAIIKATSRTTKYLNKLSHNLLSYFLTFLFKFEKKILFQFALSIKHLHILRSLKMDCNINNSISHYYRISPEYIKNEDDKLHNLNDELEDLEHHSISKNSVSDVFFNSIPLDKPNFFVDSYGTEANFFKMYEVSFIKLKNITNIIKSIRSYILRYKDYSYFNDNEYREILEKRIEFEEFYEKVEERIMKDFLNYYTTWDDCPVCSGNNYKIKKFESLFSRKSEYDEINNKFYILKRHCSLCNEECLGFNFFSYLQGYYFYYCFHCKGLNNYFLSKAFADDDEKDGCDF